MNIFRKAHYLPVLLFVLTVLEPSAISNKIHVRTGINPSRIQSDTLFFDDFNGSNLNRSNWNVVVTGFTVNNEQEAYVDSDSTIYIVHGNKADGAKHGALVIQARYRPGYITPQGHKFDFISGRINTRNKVEFKYGTISARMKLPEGSGFWPAFWALGNGRWPDTGEIDIMENVGVKDWTSVALHGPNYYGETPLVNKYYFPKNTDVTHWHIYTVSWSPNRLLFRIDGRLIYRVTRPMVEHFGRWAFDNHKFLILNLALGGGYPEKINGVKKPYPGIPETTVNTIKSGHGKVLIDWVLVTRNK